MFKEKKIVEDYISSLLQEKGWSFIPADSLERESYKEPLLIPNLSRALERINKEANIGDEEIKKAINELTLAGTGIEGARKILNFYKFGIPVKFEKERVVKYVQLFDFNDINNNEFIITRQAIYDGRERIRTDLVLYINGIPLVIIEGKDPTNVAESWFNAYRQIKDYEKKVPELFKYAQIGVAVEAVAKYFPVVPWKDEVNAEEWKMEEGELRTENNEEKIKRKEIHPSYSIFSSFLLPEVLLDIFRNFLFFRIERGEATKVVTRYMQYRTVSKIVERVKKNVIGEDEKNKGLVWHWQGSGKTLTMIFAFHKLYYLKELQNPTVFFIVDRIDLEEQLDGEFNALDIIKPEKINSVEELKEILKSDDYRGKRGAFITLIHKFRYNELNHLGKEIEKMSRTKETIMNRNNVIVFVDEAHRTQYGTLAAQMKSILRNAFFFAFTGTPISKRERDTYLEFSYPPEELYLDKYFITESIKDGFTVKIVYQPRLEREVHLKKEQLEAFLESEFEEIPEEMREEIEESVRKKINSIKAFLENPNRIKVISEDIVKHFKENVVGRFKAMVVAGSRKACELYRLELNKLLPKEYCEVVMTYRERDEPSLLKAVAETRQRYAGKDIETIRKEIIGKFKEEEYPKILIVTDMLLTGFDAPILQVLYLDKPLKEHRLLQAIARTNRPYRDLKEAGLVIDYVGILKEFKRAIEIYSKEDIEGVLFSYENIQQEFVNLLQESLEIFKDLKRDYQRKTLVDAIDILTSSPITEKEFVGKYRKLNKLFELLGPDIVKIEYLDSFKWLSAIYTYYMKTVIQKSIYEAEIEKYYKTTIESIHKSTEIETLSSSLPSITLDEQYLKQLEEKIKDKKEKSANILFTLNRLILVERHRNPIYETLVEKVERLVKMWKEKIKDYEKIYEEGVKIFEEIYSLSHRQKTLNFSDLEYSLLLTLEKNLEKKGEFVDKIKELSEKLRVLMFPGWLAQTTARRSIEREIRKFVRMIKKTYGLSLKEMDILHEKLMDCVKNYGAS